MTFNELEYYRDCYNNNLEYENELSYLYSTLARTDEEEEEEEEEQ